MAAHASFFPKMEFGTAHARDVTFDPITRNPCDLIGLAIFVTRSHMRTSIFHLFYLISYAEEFQNGGHIENSARFVISNVISE